EGDLIGIYSINRLEWIIAEYASYELKCINCPLYSTYGPESISHILNETEMKICITSDVKAISLYNDIISKYKNNLKDIIVMDPMEEKYIAMYKEKGITVHLWKDIMNEEFDFDILNEREKPTGEDLATICYTSGTSGKPKGVMLTHLNFISVISTFNQVRGSESIFTVGENDYYLSYLPLAHAMERMCVSTLIAVGGKIGFYSGNPKNLQLDIKILQPTILVGVPRVFNIFKERISEIVNKKGIIVRTLFNLAVRYKIYRQKEGIYENYFLDALLFNKVKKEFGGKISKILSGSAPLNPDV
ncbi:Long-chain-fatty-acid--CoA ligase 5, partial [Astathelohania contejeani]